MDYGFLEVVVRGIEAELRDLSIRVSDLEQRIADLESKLRATGREYERRLEEVKRIPVEGEDV